MSRNQNSTHILSSNGIHVPDHAVNSPTVSTEGQAAYLAELNVREDALLRAGNGVRDEVVFPRLRAMGVAEADLHRAAMRLVRHVQYGLDTDGSIAKFLGVIRLPSPRHGTVAAWEVV